VDAILEQAKDLKQALTNFVLEADGELAVALESYAADQLMRESYDINQRNLVIDTFLTEGEVDNQTPLDLFLEHHPNLTASDRTLLNRWRDSFIGLFELTHILPDGFELKNWLTDKHYTVKPTHPTLLNRCGGLRLGKSYSLASPLSPIPTG